VLCHPRHRIGGPFSMPTAEDRGRPVAKSTEISIGLNQLIPRNAICGDGKVEMFITARKPQTKDMMRVWITDIGFILSVNDAIAVQVHKFYVTRMSGRLQRAVFTPIGLHIGLCLKDAGGFIAPEIANGVPGGCPEKFRGIDEQAVRATMDDPVRSGYIVHYVFVIGVGTRDGIGEIFSNPIVVPQLELYPFI